LAAVELRDVSKHWGKTAAVDRVSFTAQAGNLVALLGPSGCGKSTTLRLIAGLEAADAGTITIADRRVTNLPPSTRGVSMVFQNYALFPHLSVAENIMFGLRVRISPSPSNRPGNGCCSILVAGGAADCRRGHLNHTSGKAVL
jgi:sn-glycerol 3-phosphate transport system ATP-binding protein